jgi:hypothetical protein
VEAAATALGQGRRCQQRPRPVAEGEPRIGTPPGLTGGNDVEHGQSFDPVDKDA